MRCDPLQHRITVLETDHEIHYFTRTTDCYPKPDGTFRRHKKDYTSNDIPLRGSVFVEELDEDGDRTGRFEILTPEEFRQELTEHRAPRTEYGIQRLARPEEVAPHLSLERCREVMDFLPVLKFSGEYGIVKRQGPCEPGPWEPLEAGE